MYKCTSITFFTQPFGRQMNVRSYKNVYDSFELIEIFEVRNW